MRDSQANGKKPIKEVEKLRARKPKLERVVSNSTERKKAEDEIKIFLSGIEDAYDGVAFTEMNGGVIYANEAAANIFGYSLAEMMKLNIAVFSAYPEEAKNLEEVVAKQGKWRGEIIGIRKNKEKFPAILSVSVVKDGKGKPIGRMGIFRDITERKRAEEVLRTSEQELKIRNRINNIFLTIPDEKMYAEVLNLVLEVMESKFGTFGYFGENGAFVVPAMTREIFWDKCNVPEKDIIFERGTFSGIWGRAIKEKRTLFSNQGPFNTPKGHIPVKNTMVTPIIFRDEVISAIHIANKANDYDETDQVMLETLARHIAPVLYARLQADKQNKERKRAEEALRRSKQDWENTFNAISDWVVLMDLKGRILRTNPIGEEFVGVPVAEIAGQTCCKLVHGSDTPLPDCPLLKMLQSGRSEAMELQLPNSNRWLAIAVDPVRDENGTLVGAVHITREITERKLFEIEQELTIELLHLLNATNQKHELMELVTKFLKDWSGCEAIGIRLQEGEDFPYYVTSGFPEEFIQAENYLCSVNELGEIERDSKGRPYLECMCGNVISGRFDPSKPFFTEHGSFWTNSTTELLASTTETDRMARTRNRCNTAGYESVALIPLRAGRETFGLLQFNDRQKRRFTPEKISMFERLADSLALGLAQCRAEEALRKREELHELFFSQSLDGFFYMMFDEPIRWDDTVDKEKVLDYVFAHHRITKINDAMLQQYGASREQFIGLTPNDLYAHDIAYGRNVWRDFFDAGRLHLETDERKLDGTPIRIEGDYICLYDSQGRITGHFGVQREITEEKRAREALRESEQKYRALIEQSLQGIIILQEFQIVFANPTAAKIAGLMVDEVLALTPEDIKAFIPAEERAATLQRFEERLADKPVEQNYELRLVRKNGDGFWLDVFVSQIEYLGKSAIQVAFIDITERKQAEEAYRSLVDHSLQGLEIFQNGRAVFANQAMADITGYTVEEMLTLPPGQVQAFVHPDDRELVWGRHRGRLNGEELPERYEFRGIRKDGSMCWVEIHASRIEYQGKPAIQAAYVDITERKKAEEKLQESEKRFCDIALSSADWIWEIDKNGKYTFASGKVKKILDYSPEELIGTSPFDFMPKEEAEKISEIFRKIAAEKKPIVDLENWNLSKSGKRVLFLTNGIPLLDEKGNLLGYRGVDKDITKRKQAEEALRESEEHYRMLAGTMNDGLGVIDEKARMFMSIISLVKFWVTLRMK